MQTEVISEGKIQEKRGISSAVLKNIAVVTMFGGTLQWTVH